MGRRHKIKFITEDAAVSVAAVTQATQKTKKSSTRKNMNEEAGNYYSEMLKIQKEVDETVDGSDLREVDERG